MNTYHYLALIYLVFCWANYLMGEHIPHDDYGFWVLLLFGEVRHYINEKIRRGDET